MKRRRIYVLKNISNLDADIRDRVVAESRARRITISDVVGLALADEWQLAYDVRSDSRTSAQIERDSLNISDSSDQFVVRLPQEMCERIWLIARARRLTESSVVQEVLARQFELAYTPVRRGGVTRRKRSIA